MANRLMNNRINKVIYLLVCLVFYSCRTFDNIPGMYMKGNEFTQVYNVLYMYPDSTYMWHYWQHGLEEACDSGVWHANVDRKSIDFRSTLPDLMNIPIDVIEEQTDSGGITIIFDRPYDYSINAEESGIEKDMLEWEITIDDNKFLLEHDTLWLNKSSIENISLAAVCPEPIRNYFSPPFINHEIRTEVYNVKDSGCNRFTIFLPPYTRPAEYRGSRKVEIYNAVPLNRTIYWKKLKKCRNFKNFKRSRRLGLIRFLL